MPVGHATCVRVRRSVTWTAHGIVSPHYICVCVEPPTVSSAYIVRESCLGVSDSARAVAIATDELYTKSAFCGLLTPKIGPNSVPRCYGKSTLFVAAIRFRWPSGLVARAFRASGYIGGACRALGQAVQRLETAIGTIAH